MLPTFFRKHSEITKKMHDSNVYLKAFLFFLNLANDTADIVNVGEQSVTCPHLVKYTSTGISRQGNILQAGHAYGKSSYIITINVFITN